MALVKYKQGVRVQTKTKTPKFGTVIQSTRKGFYSIQWDGEPTPIETSVHSMKVVPDGAGKSPESRAAGNKRAAADEASDEGEPEDGHSSESDEEEDGEDEEEVPTDVHTARSRAFDEQYADLVGTSVTVNHIFFSLFC